MALLDASSDALNRVLNALRLKPQLFYRLELTTLWGMALSGSHHASFHLVERGQCWLRIEGRAPLQMCAGDLVVISNTAHYELVDSLDSAVIPLTEFIKQHNVVPDDYDSKTVLICGEFRPAQPVTYPLFSLLPQLIQIDSTVGLAADWLSGPLKMIAREAQHAYPGHDLVISRLMDVLFIMVLRYWIANHLTGDGGWLSALYHPQMGHLLSLMHQYPEKDWTVDLLAQTVNMSRSTFTAQFQAMIGESPMRYLALLRIQLAMMWLSDDPNMTVEAIANRVGYSSPFAFSRAFKRIVGVSPTAYRSGGHDEPEQ